MAGPYAEEETLVWLRQCRRNLGEAPRRFGLWERLTYLTLFPPSWVWSDPLLRLYTKQFRLLREGTLVWAHVVQANSLLFSPGPWDSPGEVIFCPNPGEGVTPEQLAPIAKRIYALKGTQPSDPRERHLADHLTNERTRRFGLRVPETLGATFPCYLSTLMFPRKHLPNRQLEHPFFPVLVLPEGEVLFLPARYWS